MRRILVLALLFLGLRLITPLGDPGTGADVLLAFGFLVLAAYTVGEIAAALRVPMIVGYMAAGMVFGPSMLGILSTADVARLAPVSELAVALIAFLAGAELRWHDVRREGPALAKVLVSELLLSYVVLAGTFFALRRWLPLLDGLPTVTVVVFALLFASIAIVHSPAVTLALLSETGARGPLARAVLGIVLLADIIVVLLFTGTLAAARALVPPVGAVEVTSVGTVVWEIGGAVLLGLALGGGVAAYLRFVGKELVLFAVLVAFFGLQIAGLLHVELLLSLLIAGFLTENVSRHGEPLRHAMERSAAPIFVVFFALAGAQIEIHTVVALLPVIVPLALARAAAIWAGTRIGGRWGGIEPTTRRRIWMGLISQAGVAIGLAAVVADAYGEFGRRLQTLLLALIALNQIAGPILFRRALQAAGEIKAERAPARLRAAVG